MNVTKKRIPLRMPTEEEDREITAAALSDPDNPPLTDEQLDQMVPYHVVMRGRPRLANPKRQVTIRYSVAVIDYFRGTGDGWQSRMDEVLLDYVKGKVREG